MSNRQPSDPSLRSDGGVPPEELCVCGHRDLSHPFGLSGNLILDGHCQACDCKSFQAGSSSLLGRTPGEEQTEDQGTRGGNRAVSEHGDLPRRKTGDDSAPVTKCRNFSPPWFEGRWRDWHRGHGCDLDDGKPRTPDGAYEIAKTEQHRCSGCGRRWEGPSAPVELCGDCWRRGQAGILGEPPQPRDGSGLEPDLGIFTEDNSSTAGFWGRAAAREIQKRKAVESQRDELLAVARSAVAFLKCIEWTEATTEDDAVNLQHALEAAIAKAEG